jgi:hypothetical protein
MRRRQDAELSQAECWEAAETEVVELDSKAVKAYGEVGRLRRTSEVRIGRIRATISFSCLVWSETEIATWIKRRFGVAIWCDVQGAVVCLSCDNGD